VSKTAAQIAEEQLRRLAASGGAVQVVSGPNPYLLKGWVTFDISLDLAGIARTAEGIDLRQRERFIIAIGPHFPFTPPTVHVRHTRWAGTPHVNWASTLCLYLAPALEWSPTDGMRGFLDHLLHWLECAACANLDPAGRPPHPPVAYPNPAAGLAVIRADIGNLAPEARSTHTTPTTLVGWGGVSGDRIDIDAWYSTEQFQSHFDSDSLPIPPTGSPIAVACVLLHAPIAFEYPNKLGELAQGLAAAGLDLVTFHTLIRQVAVASAAHLPNAAAEPKTKKTPLLPVTVFVGSPSRSVDGYTFKTHLVGFSIDPRTTDLDTLFAGLATPGQSTGRAGDDATPLSWLTVYERRPEITQRRDYDSPIAWLHGKRVLVLGCGALGAPVAEHCVRAGAEVTVADRARVTPGILVRQPFYDQDVGEHKAAVLARRLNGITRGPGPATPIAEDVIDAFFDGVGLPDYDLIIDATANAGVRAAIEAARAPERATSPRLITMLIGHTATIGLVTTSQPNATGAGHDVLRRVGIAARQPASGLDDVAAEFFQDPPRTELFQPEPGCSEPTFTGSAADVTGLASAMLLAGIEAVARPDTSAPMTAHAIRSPRAATTTSGTPRAAATHLGWPNDIVEQDESGNYEVRLSQASLTDIRAEARRRARLHPDVVVETGGMLIGAIDESATCIYVDRACPPTPDSLLSTQHFEHGTQGAQELVDHFRASSARASGFIGMWHTHPEGAAWPSLTDEHGMASLVVPVDGTGRGLMLIIGGQKPRWEGWRDGNGAPAIYARYINATTASASSSQPPRPPGRYIRAGAPDAPRRAFTRRGFPAWLRPKTLARRSRR
jgi:integrative and conjugative element protein (TIGR02256 family)